MRTPNGSGVGVEEFRTTLSEFPTFVTVVTSDGPAGPVGCTANAVLSLSLQPPSMVVSLSSRGRTAHHVTEAGSLGINVLTWHQCDLIQRFATGEPRRRFDDVPHHYRDGVPMLDGAAVNLVCYVERTVELLDHVLVVSRVTWTEVDQGKPALVLHRNTPQPLYCDDGERPKRRPRCRS